MDQTLAGTMRILSGGVADLEAAEELLWADPRLIEELVGLWRCPVLGAAPAATFRPYAADYDAP